MLKWSNIERITKLHVSYQSIIRLSSYFYFQSICSAQCTWHIAYNNHLCTIYNVQISIAHPSHISFVHFILLLNRKSQEPRIKCIVSIFKTFHLNIQRKMAFRRANSIIIFIWWTLNVLLWNENPLMSQ